MQLSVLTSITGVVVLACILELLRRQQLREKYAAIWLGIGAVVAPLGFFPTVLNGVAHKIGVANGASLVLFAGFILVLLVCLHLSWESSRLEAETRILSEEVALVRSKVAEHTVLLAALDAERRRTASRSDDPAMAEQEAQA
ncbi:MULTISPECIES: DUF2304 domain-containing protein [Streptacidiphilus]|uniref:DUF2304 domain-containing protein n=1 Tax=Streptacidiphilus cavernicola TaxID=3342716 RepID=A0ABV6UGF5_9ACTN|nr:DUF2304 domain-containing protein [Streptacidiphilus jeojiense]